MDKKVALLDVDGVLADFTGSLSLAIGYEGEFKTWELAGTLPPDMLQKAQELMKVPGFWESLFLLPRATILVEGLRESGYRVVFVTAPSYCCDKWVDARKHWLEKYFKPTVRDMVFTVDKSLVHGDFLVEDKLSNAQAWTDKWKTASFLVDRPYNQGDLRGTGIVRVKDYEEILFWLNNGGW